jgi:hypothetical protein
MASNSQRISSSTSVEWSDVSRDSTTGHAPTLDSSECDGRRPSIRPDDPSCSRALRHCPIAGHRQNPGSPWPRVVEILESHPFGLEVLTGAKPRRLDVAFPDVRVNIAIMVGVCLRNRLSGLVLNCASRWWVEVNPRSHAPPGNGHCAAPRRSQCRSGKLLPDRS